jgi:hypothetical protein
MEREENDKKHGLVARVLAEDRFAKEDRRRNHRDRGQSQRGGFGSEGREPQELLEAPEQGAQEAAVTEVVGDFVVEAFLGNEIPVNGVERSEQRLPARQEVDENSDDESETNAVPMLTQRRHGQIFPRCRRDVRGPRRAAGLAVRCLVRPHSEASRQFSRVRGSRPLR